MITATVLSFIILFDRSAITLPKARRLFRQSAAIIERELPAITLQPRRFKRLRNVPRIRLQDQRIGLGLYSSYFNESSEHAVLLAPPGESVTDTNLEFGIGQAVICGRRGYIAIVKKGNWMMNVIGLTHEIGHMLGAEHTPDDDSVMNPMPVLVSYYRNWQTYFSEVSKEEIKTCTEPTLSAL